MLNNVILVFSSNNIGQNYIFISDIYKFDNMHNLIFIVIVPIQQMCLQHL